MSLKFQYIAEDEQFSATVKMLRDERIRRNWNRLHNYKSQVQIDFEKEQHLQLHPLFATEYKR
jgi:hypothetical protein